MRSVRLALVALTACRTIAGIDGEFRAVDATDGDATIERDANTVGWPTNGGVGPRTCTSSTDEDGDSRVDDCDNCPLDPNDQNDGDFDGIGDLCDPHPEFAVERLRYFSGFNGVVASEGARIGATGTYVVDGGLLRQTSTTAARTLFMLAEGPWRQPTIELKVASYVLNGTDPDIYAGLYLLQSVSPTTAEPRPDSVMCLVRWGPNPGLRLVRLRDNNEVKSAATQHATAATHTMVCSAARLGELPASDGDGGNPAPAALTNRITIAEDTTDVETVKVGVWTYHARADFSGVAVYETVFP